MRRAQGGADSTRLAHRTTSLGYLPPDVGVPNRYSRAPGASRGSAQGGGDYYRDGHFFYIPCHEAVSLHVGLACVLLGSKSATCFVCAHWALRAARPEHVRAARREHAVRVRPRKLGW